MKRDTFTLPLAFPGELIIDNFAGGGGTSTGLEAAFGRPVDIAINHNAEALAMHAANHPHTRHLCESVWDVDPIAVTQNQPVGLVWLSPDCKHFSKAKGGKPVEKDIRGLAWIGVRWIVRTKPRGFMLENVEEFQTWGPLMTDQDGNTRPDPAKKGQTFRVFKQMLTTGVPMAEREGNESIEDARVALCTGPLAFTEAEFALALNGLRYTVECAELKACDYGTPTIRKRFFMVGRRDGLPTVARPPVSHAAPTSKEAKSGKLQPWLTAAECIDWSIPCPSIFDRKKPLADATLRRIAKGIMRYVVNSASPFIVNLTHQGGDRLESLGEPLRTITGAHRGEKALIDVQVASFVANTANSKTTGRAPNHWTAEEPLRTITSAPGFAAVAATLVQTGYGERVGQAPRALDIGKPLGTVVGGAAKHALVSAFLAKHYTGVVGSDMVDPVGTVTGVDHHSLVTATMVTIDNQSSTSGQSAITEPLKTTVTENRHALVAAHLVHMGHGEQANGKARWSHGVRAVEVPLNTVAASGMPAAIVTSNLVKLRGTNVGSATDEPLHTVSAGGQHHAEVRAFLLSYYGTDQNPDIAGPLATVTSRDRFGLVTIHGQDYQIVDIGLRMLSPRELFRAQGFPASYIIGDDERQGLKLTKSAQVRMCGNSVPPPLAEALARANFAHEALIYGRQAA
ncbi:MAG: DNA cytosine methyltransferase [Rhodoferax sp.]|nr:DNA cytosine methyltransferase [Rhodoferax sp.]MDP3651077.1 DNA cytosine methyltransferase [Rhodoferax sp.]